MALTKIRTSNGNRAVSKWLTKLITRKLLWQIKTGPNSWMKQSEFTATTCNLLQAQDKSWLQGTMYTASYWLKNWCSNIWYITIAQSLLTVIYLKTAPNQSDLSLTSGRGGGPSSNILLKIGMRKAAVFPDPITKVKFFLTTCKQCP